MTAEYERPETWPVDVEPVTTDSPGVEAAQTALALVGIEADYVPDEFIRT
jgi:hypothetical protein